MGGLEPAEDLACRSGMTVESQPHEVALDGPRRGHPPGVITGGKLGGDQLTDVGCGPPGMLTLEPHRQLQQLLIRQRRAGPQLGDQPVEPLTTPGTDPTVDGRTRDAHQLPVRAAMLPQRQLTYQPATLTRAQPLIGGLTDQRITEQADLTATFVFHPDSSLPVTAAEPSRLRRRWEGRARVAQQPPTAHRRHKPPQRHRTARPTGRRHRGQRIPSRCAGRLDPRQTCIQRQRPTSEMRPDPLPTSDEPAKPAPHRRAWQPQLSSDPPPAPTAHRKLQHPTDRLDRITTAQQHQRR
jgi:hypothetical protein